MNQGVRKEGAWLVGQFENWPASGINVWQFASELRAFCDKAAEEIGFSRW